MRALCLAIALGTGVAAAFGPAMADSAGRVQQAEAADAKLADFVGPWVGSTGPNAAIVRNATVLIERKGQGFTITWTNFEAEGDKAAMPVTERKRKMTFEPSKRAGFWRAAGADDPVTGHAGWAHIKGRTLTISVIAVLADGRLEHQIYDRTLTAKGMTLTYRRVLDGKVVKTIDANFLKL